MGDFSLEMEISIWCADGIEQEPARMSLLPQHAAPQCLVMERFGSPKANLTVTSKAQSPRKKNATLYVAYSGLFIVLLSPLLLPQQKECNTIAGDPFKQSATASAKNEISGVYTMSCRHVLVCANGVCDFAKGEGYVQLGSAGMLVLTFLRSGSTMSTFLWQWLSTLQLIKVSRTWSFPMISPANTALTS